MPVDQYGIRYDEPTTPAPKAVSTPTTPIATPVSVVSAAPAIDEINNKIAPEVATANANIANQNANNAAVYNPNGDLSAANLALAPKPITPPKTAEDQILNTPDQGNQFIYNNQTGERTQAPVATAIPTGYSATDYKNASSVESVMDTQGNTIKKFADGTYARYDAKGDYTGTTTSQDYNTTKGVSDIGTKLDQLANGTFPLSATEQAAIDSIKATYAKVIKDQETANANYTGGMTIAQNLYGMGNTMTGQGQIQKTIDDGISLIADLNSKMNADISKMTMDMKHEDYSELSDTYNRYVKNQEDRQAEIARIETATRQAAKDASDAAYQQQQLKQDNDQFLATAAYQQQQLSQDQSQFVATQQQNQSQFDSGQAATLQINLGNVALEAAKNGASQAVLTAIRLSKSVAEAVAAAGASLVTPDTQIITLDDGNTIIVDKKTGNVVKNLGGARAVATPSISEQLGAAEAGYNIDSSGKITSSATVSIPSTTLAGKNNNPGNLRFVGQAGASKGQGGFASFATPEAGYQALLNQISLDASRGLTVAQFVNKYAPPSENNTGQYINQLTAKLGCSANTKLSTLDLGKVGEFMAMKESGTKITGAPSTTGGPGTSDATVTAWAERIANGTAKISDIPASQATLRNQVTVALQSQDLTENGKPTTTEMGKEALKTASSLLTKLYASDWGSNAVGTSGVTNIFNVPGQDRANFINDFNSLKSQLSLEGVKFLKGQGQVSDAERALLASAVTKLNLKQSDQEFHDTLKGIIDKLQGGVVSTPTTSYSGVYLPGAVTSNLNVFNGVSLPN